MSRMIYKPPRIGLARGGNEPAYIFGAPMDRQVDHIHFSTADQVAETAAKYFSGMDDLVLVAVDPTSLGPMLKWERSRGGALFPHLF